jgi:hypothetical protein
MNRLEKEIRERMEAAASDVLRGAAVDFADYKTVITRYQVLRELAEFANDLKKEPPSLGDPEDE